MKPRSLGKYVFDQSDIVWSLNISIWAKIRRDINDIDIINEMFDHDWNIIQYNLPTIISKNKNELIFVRKKLKQN